MDYNETDREELLRRLEAKTDDEIDYSDIPEITDFSKFRPLRERLEREFLQKYDWDNNRFCYVKKGETQTDEKEKTDEIDYSDIPEITDFSKFRPARIHFLHNSERAYRLRQEKTRRLQEAEKFSKV